MEKNIIGRMNSLLEEMPEAERKIAHVIIENPEKIIHMTASELGKQSQTSASTVIRLCKRVGITSFTQLKVFLSREVNRTERKEYSDITANEPIEEIMDKLLGNAFKSMQDTVSLLSKETLGQAVKSIQDADVIYTFGVGASHLVAEDIAHKWSRIGKTCISLSDPHQLIAAMTAHQENTLFFGISNSGETPEVIRLLDRANDNHCQTIGLSRFGKNSVSERAKISIQHVKAIEEELRSAATSSLHAQFLTIDILFYQYASTHYEQIINQIAHSREEIETYNQG